MTPAQPKINAVAPDRAGFPKFETGATIALGPLFALEDAMRRVQAAGMRMLGYGSLESDYRIVASGHLWRLRRYASAADGLVVLVVAAPIKRPYIWDLAPTASAVRECVRQSLQVCLLEWAPPSSPTTTAGLAAYADDAISEAVSAALKATSNSNLFLMGHSLGGTLAAISANLHPEHLSGVVLVSALLSFALGIRRFRDALAAMAPAWLPEIDVMPGCLLSHLSAAASPETFVWSRFADAAASAADPRAADMRLRIEQWALDEASLSGPLIRDIFCWLYREDRLCKGALVMNGRKVSPADFRIPILAVANAADDVAPPASMTAFLDAVATADKRFIEAPSETGVVLQHLAVLIGRKALASIWPEIIDWIKGQDAETY